MDSTYVFPGKILPNFNNYGRILSNHIYVKNVKNVKNLKNVKNVKKIVKNVKNIKYLKYIKKI